MSAIEPTVPTTAIAERADVDEVIPPPGTVTGHLPALVDVDGNVLALVQDDPWADVDAGDLVPRDEDSSAGIPRLMVNRKSDGGFITEGTGEVFRTLEMVWMARSQTRAWWPEPFGKGEAEPACRSDNGVEPSPRSPAQQDGWTMPVADARHPVIGEMPAKTCKECPNSLWDGDNPPACAVAIEAMIAIPDFEQRAVQLARLRFSGMGYGPADRYWDTFDARLPKRPPIAYVTRVTLEPEDTPNGVFLRPRFERRYELTREQAQPILAERTKRLGEWQEAIANAPVVDDDLSTSARRTDDGAPREDEEPF